jgi:cytoskeletal protein CcmA (bactofilin family)
MLQTKTKCCNRNCGQCSLKSFNANGIGKDFQMSNQTQQPANTPEMTVIGADTRIKGEMFFEKSARILGSFEGKITAQGEVQIGNGAHCNAAVEAEQIIVDGSVQGPLFARDRLTLTANAQVQGDLTAGTLVVAQGASFVGHCNVGPRANEMTGNTNTQSNQATPAPATNTEPKPQLTTQLDLTPPWATQPNGSSVA